MSKVLADTNVLIYAKDNSSVFHQHSINLFNGADDVFITYKNVSEYYAVVTKGESPLLSPEEAAVDITEFLTAFGVLYASPQSQERLLALISRYKPRGLQIHDFEIAAIALANGISKIATFNTSDFEKIKEIDPFKP